MFRLIFLSLLLASVVAFSQQPAAPAKPAAPAAAPAVTPATVPAAEQPSRDDVLKLLSIVHVQDQIEDMQNELAGQIADNIIGDLDLKQITPEQQGRLHDAALAAVDDVRSAYPTSQMIGDLIPVYQKHLTRSDVQAAIAFFSTPAGQKFITEAPQMMQEALVISRPKIEQAIESVRPKIEERMRSALATQPAPKPAPPAAHPAPAPPPK